MEKQRLFYLLDQYRLSTLTAAEQEELEQITHLPDDASVLATLTQLMQETPSLSKGTAEEKHRLLTRVLTADLIGNTNLIENTNATTNNYPSTSSASDPVTIPATHRIHFLKTMWFRYAAAVIIILATGAYFWFSNQKKEPSLAKDNSNYLKPDIQPGWNRAILTLANGQQILLDSTQGNIKQGNVTVINLAGKLKYEGVGTRAEYNTISTPKGGQYQIVLPDGTRVWLNSASSIKFPTVFTDNVRTIEMTGEAYMEVAKNARQSFTVKASGVEIQVLGTSFNMNAYADEETIKTTLLEGSVKVVAMNSKPGSQLNNKMGSAVALSSDQLTKTILLKPGQQAILAPTAMPGQQSIHIIKNADMEQVLAWKNGVFRFNQTNLADAMRQLARWYDVEVVYEKGVPDIKLDGGIKRDLALSQVLNGLGRMGLKYRIKGRRVIVMQ